jgi:hypothetical protein
MLATWWAAHRWAPVTEHVNWYGERSVVLRHLTPATPYTFTVQASDFSGNTATSNAVNLTTEATSDVTPPSAPTNVRIVEEGGCAEVWVGWTQSTDDTDAQSAIEYEIYVNGVLSPLPVGAGIDRDFVYGTAHGDNTFTVKAVDRAGNTSEASNAFRRFSGPAEVRCGLAPTEAPRAPVRGRTRPAANNVRSAARPRRSAGRDASGEHH